MAAPITGTALPWWGPHRRRDGGAGTVTTVWRGNAGTVPGAAAVTRGSRSARPGRRVASTAHRHGGAAAPITGTALPWWGPHRRRDGGAGTGTTVSRGNPGLREHPDDGAGARHTAAPSG